MRKSPAVAYIYMKIRTSSKHEIYEELDDAPITIREYSFISDIIEGLSISELATKYNLCPSRISQWKRELCERLHRYDLAQIRKREKNSNNPQQS